MCRSCHSPPAFTGTTGRGPCTMEAGVDAIAVSALARPLGPPTTFSTGEALSPGYHAWVEGAALGGRHIQRHTLRELSVATARILHPTTSQRRSGSCGRVGR